LTDQDWVKGKQEEFKTFTLFLSIYESNTHFMVQKCYFFDLGFRYGISVGSAIALPTSDRTFGVIAE
jgi:hypothetical protein